jgi:hypothetical protein
MNTDGIVVIFALVAALGLLGVTAIETISIPQPADKNWFNDPNICV